MTHDDFHAADHPRDTNGMLIRGSDLPAPTVPDPFRDLTSVEMAVQIISAFVAHNAVPAADLPNLIRSVHGAIVGLGQPEATKEAAPLKPAVPISRSVTQDYIVCLENGKRFKSLKRHLQSAYGLSPERYRAKWGLAHDYPMVAPAYSDARSNLARTMGLGRKAA